MILTPTELSKLEEIVYPGKRRAAEFYPSLEGSELQRLQALDCIVAALKLGKESSIKRHSNGEFTFCLQKGYRAQANWVEADLLTAAIRALVKS